MASGSARRASSAVTTVCLSWALLTAFAGTTPVAAQPWPELRLTAPAAPGGGWDQTARALQQALQAEGLVRSAPVENVVGAAGTIGLARFMGAERGRGDALMVSGLIMLGGVVMHRSPITLHDVTPIARLTGEYEVIVVPAASTYRTLDDLITALRANPEAISWGGGSAGGSDQMLAGLFASAVGVEPRRINYVAFSGGGESLAAIVGGQVSVGINGLAELEPQIEAGTVRALGISSAERLPGLAVPTLREQGVALEFENWRSVVAPPGISAADRERLRALVAAVVRTPAWTDLRARYRWLDRYLDGDAFTQFAVAEESRVREVLTSLGVGDDRAGETTSGPGPALYPWLVIVLLAVTGAGTAWMSRAAPSRPVRRETPSGSLAPLLWVGLGLVVNLFAAETLGFVPASAMVFWTTARAFDRTHPSRDAVCALGIAFAAYLLFDRALGLPLPSGWLGSML